MPCPSSSPWRLNSALTSQSSFKLGLMCAPARRGLPPAMAYLVEKIGTNRINSDAAVYVFRSGSTGSNQFYIVVIGFGGTNPSVRGTLPMMKASIWRRPKRETLSSAQFEHDSLVRVIHRDVKPANIPLDGEMVAKISDFGMSTVLHAHDYTHIPMGRAVPFHIGLLDAKFSGKPSAKHGTETKIVSHMTHLQRYFSLHNHPLIQMLTLARKWSGDTFTRCVILIPQFKFSGIAEPGWISAKPKYENPSAGRIYVYMIRKYFNIRKWLNVNESQQHSEPDSYRSGNEKMEANTKTSDCWIITTGAPHHATGNRNLLSGFIMEHDDQFVHAVNRVPMKVLARGAVVTDALIIPDVWFVPGLKENLVSISQLAELDHSIGFGRGECCIRSARDARIVGAGRLQKGGHYVLDYLKVPLAI